jgi:hypothetical protein
MLLLGKIRTYAKLKHGEGCKASKGGFKLKEILSTDLNLF